MNNPIKRDMTSLSLFSAGCPRLPGNGEPLSAGHIQRGSSFVVRDVISPLGRDATVLERRGRYLFFRCDEGQRRYYGTGKVVHDATGREIFMPDIIRDTYLTSLETAYVKFRLATEWHEDFAAVRQFDNELTLNKLKQ